ncbi:MAG: aspartyl-phosphate phosphatase Spo0E family protein [Syntrophomonadaceae bacterium]|nr:aspartyl-phosphate phosphatase Spo0E family protein [Syntrophomonadaceae bacterium]
MRIIQSIEELRKELNELGTIKGLHDPEVIRLSQKLDEIINTYYRLRRPKIYGNSIKSISNK